VFPTHSRDLPPRPSRILGRATDSVAVANLRSYPPPAGRGLWVDLWVAVLHISLSARKSRIIPVKVAEGDPPIVGKYDSISAT
jgi:hypothetical protein